MNIVLLGPPAAGKGTLSESLVKEFGFIHISTGDLLRKRAASRGNTKLQAMLDNGELVPDMVVCKLVAERLAKKDCQQKGVLLDGFPRTKSQAEMLQAAGVRVSAVIHLEIPDSVVMTRITGRRIDNLTGHVYHMVFKPPPKEALTRLIHRSDDTPERHLLGVPVLFI